MPDSILPSGLESYTCGICGKKFDRRDLRNRHKRRCIRTTSNPRKSKQKSCYSCASSKLSCDLRLPSCSRCTTRKLCCEYAFSISSREESRPTGDVEVLPDVNESTMQALEDCALNGKDVQKSKHSSINFYLPADNNSAESTSPSHNQTSEDATITSLRPPDSQLNESPIQDDGMNGSAAQSSDISSTNILNDDLTGTMINMESLQYDLDLDKSLAETVNLALSAGYQPPDAQSPFQVNDASILSDGYNMQWLSSSLANFHPTSEQDWSNCSSNFSIEQSSDFSFNLMGSFGIPGSHTPGTAFQKMSTGGPGSVFNTPSWKPPLRHQTSNYAEKEPEDSLSLVLLNGYLRTAPIDHISNVINVQARDLQVSPFGQGSDFTSYPFDNTSGQATSHRGLAKILLEFPQMMARPGGRYPPFVHHKIYRCEEGDVLKPLAIAFCCVTALNAAFPSGKGFVHSLMNAERDRLLKEFRLLRDSELEMIAAMHAMCVYQIIGFFDDSSSDSARFTELQQPFFLRMARRLIALYMPQLRSPYDSSDFSDLAWNKWTSTETVRRTFFLIHIINVVACRTEKQNSYFYEELDDDLVMNLPLPAPEKIWKANSAMEWKSAIEGELQSGWRPNSTASMILSESRLEENTANSSEWNLRDDSVLSGDKAAGRNLLETNLSGSHEFSRILIHCINRKGRG